MAVVYTRRLGVGRGTQDEYVDLYTAGPGTTVVRDLVFANESGASVAAQFRLITAGQAFVGPLWLEPAVPANSSRHADVRQAMSEGDRLQAYSSSSSWSAAVTGYVFSS